MPNDLNRVCLLARVGADPEVRYSQGGNAILNMSVATNRTWKKDGDEHKQTNWHRVVIFGKLAEIMANMIRKGTRLYLEGSMETRSWEQNGDKRYTTEVVVRPYEGNVTLVSDYESSGSGGSMPSAPPASSQQAPSQG